MVRVMFVAVVAFAVLASIPGLVFAAGSGAPAQCGAEKTRAEWVAAGYVARQVESLAAVDISTAAVGLSYRVKVYGRLEQGNLRDLLGEVTGSTGDPGFYSIRFDTPVSLREGERFYLVLRLEGGASEGKFLDPSTAHADRQPFLTVEPDKAFRTANGSDLTSVSGNEVPFALRAVAEDVHPEATSITRFVADPMITAGSSMKFTFSATGTNKGDPLTWTLKFGDGTADSAGTGASPIVDNPVTHTYDLAGNYTATLYVIDTKDASSAQASMVITVAIPVTAEADPDCGLAALNVCFTGGASHGTEPYTFTWVFGDGQSSREQSPCHVYLTAGTYSAILTVTDAIGARGIAAPVSIRVSLPMIVSITSDVTDGIPPTVVNFCANVSRGLTPYTYAWTFGDGGAATDKCPQHVFNEVGAYTVALTVTDDCSQAVDASTLTVTVHASPWIRITSPANGATVRGDVPLQVAIMVEQGVTIKRVDYYFDNVYTGSVTAPPWAGTLDGRGVHGLHTLTAKVTDSKNRSTTSDGVQVNFDNPVLDGRVDSMDHPFRLRVYGLFFERGCVVKINGTQVPVTQRKGTNLVLAKGDNALKALVPEGVPVMVTVWNPDGGISQEATFTRP